MNVLLLTYSIPAGATINQSQHTTVYSIAHIFETRHRLSPVAVIGRGRQQLWRDQDHAVTYNVTASIDGMCRSLNLYNVNSGPFIIIADYSLV